MQIFTSFSCSFFLDFCPFCIVLHL
jgi:hypothetical protein